MEKWLQMEKKIIDTLTKGAILNFKKTAFYGQKLMEGSYIFGGNAEQRDFWRQNAN
jgi:hypothetical protein